ncbi:unnamed protein product, partial [Musa textilis]
MVTSSDSGGEGEGGRGSSGCWTAACLRCPLTCWWKLLGRCWRGYLWLSRQRVLCFCREKGLAAIVDDAVEGLLHSLGGDLADAADTNLHEGRAGGWGRPALYRGGDGGAPPAGESRLDE